MFSFFKKKEEEGILLGAPIKGKAMNITEVNDPTFSECMLGKGIAIIPSEGKVYAPADGTINLLFDTLHAVSMVTEEGVELLIHVGLETVKLKGDGFEAHIQTGDAVKKGDLLLTVDLEKIREAGCDTVTPVVICNTDDYKDVQNLAGGEVEPGDNIIKIVQQQ